MSLTLLEFARSYVAGRLKAEVFSEAYIKLWKIERDSNVLQLDEPSLSECLSSIFVLRICTNQTNLGKNMNLTVKRLEPKSRACCKK